MESQDEKREQLYELVDALEARTKELARADPPLSSRAEATILADLNEIRQAVADDTSAGEYLADDDRTKATGYNRLPHRPARPDHRRQAREARRGERHPAEGAPG